MKLHIDIETYSSLDLKKTGVYRYLESPDFEILLIAYAIDDQPVQIIEQPLKLNATDDDELFELCVEGWLSEVLLDFISYLQDPNIELHAHNAAFERLALNKFFGLEIPADRWFCSMVKSAYCGLPLQLEAVSKVLNLGDKGKLDTGTALINYFCKPCKPTKTNEGRTRNLPHHDPEKWDQFKKYGANDVEAEREIDRILSPYELPKEERDYYILDQLINDRGVKIDAPFAKKAINIDALQKKELFAEVIKLTGVENPNSDAQLKDWLFAATGGLKIESLAKEPLADLIEELSASPTVDRVLRLRQETGKTSIKKYHKMISSLCSDGRGRGYYQYYGANRTGRWAGRFVQLQNLPKNYLQDLDVCRQLVDFGDYDLVNLSFDNVSDTLSQLIRTAFIPEKDHLFDVADFSAIESRITAWLAGEEWRLDIFRTHGKIYEASAASMFNVPIESIDKGSPLRQKGKIAELALGFGGSVGAMVRMGGEKMGLSESDLREIVDRWRLANPAIVNYWSRLDGAAKRALKTKRPIHVGEIIFLYDGLYLTIQLPSQRKLFYYKPGFTRNRFGGESIKYMGMDQDTKKWGFIETYGGKLTENVVQAISRDLLAFSMVNVEKQLGGIAMHTHDEIIKESPKSKAAAELEEMIRIMSIAPQWAKDLPLRADGYITEYYKKD